MSDSNLPCFKCGKRPKVDDHEILWGAVTFTSRGNFGSTIYDPMSRRKWLRIHICDDCVKEGAHQGIVLEGTRKPVPDEVTYQVFDPDKNEYNSE